MSATPETILAFDFGERRIGVAVGQRVTRSATPLVTVTNGADGPDWEQIRKIIAEWRPDRLVVGIPLHEDGSESETGDVARAFMRELALFELPIHGIDERYSSQEAKTLLKARRNEGLSGRLTKEMVDSAAAMLIAERFLAADS